MGTLVERRQNLLIGFLLVLALVLSACGGAATTAAPEPTEAPAEPTAAPTEAENDSNGTGQTPAVTVSDQELADGTVVVDSVTAADAGWMVIHADADGSPGPVIGHSAVEAGLNENVEVALDTDSVTSTLYAMLHLDNGTAGEYEFPDADPPVRVDDQVVVVPFQLEMGSAMETNGTTVAAADSDLGTILVGPEGFALYLLTADSPSESTCADACAEAWPPLTAEADPQAGEGADASLLATLERADGTSQVTYNGWPLYYYSGDSNPGQTGGQAFESFGGTWYVVNPQGQPVENGANGSADGGDDVDDLY